MNKTRNELSQIAKRAVATRQKKAQHAKSQKAGKKAWKETIIPSEFGFITQLVKTHGIDRSCIFHHEGLPDIMVIAGEGKMRFYEIKPKKGSRLRKMLNPSQAETIRELMNHDYVEEVNLVQYERKGKQVVYSDPIKLTKQNLKEYSY